MKIEGKNAVAEALKSGTQIDLIYAEKGSNHPIIAIARENGIKIKFVDKMILDKESVTGRHQGFIAVATEFEYSEIEDILSDAENKGEAPFIIILDGIEDPHNLGSILRVADCCGAHGVVIPKNRAVSVNETVIRVSAGAAEHVKVAKVTNLNTTIKQLKEKGVWIYAADMDGELIYNVNLKGSLAIVVGGEGKGISRLTKELCDGVVALPMQGKISSLNASVACGIVTYEALRQRLGR